MSTTDKPKLLIISGEKSGEMHAAKVAANLRELNPAVEMVGWGGDEMQRSGVRITRRVETLSLMGFWEVIKRIFFIRKLFSECKSLIVNEKPDAILLVDYSGFNLRIARWATGHGFKCYYYIPPKTWAWNQKRTYKLARSVEKVFSILPFEIDFFRQYGVNVTYVGNPTLDTIRQHQDDTVIQDELKKQKPVAALIPGSRPSEIRLLLPIMVTLKKQFPQFHFVVSGISALPKELYQPAINEQIDIVYDKFYDVLKSADAAVATSGTATLETALLGVPQVVVFKASPLTYFIARWLVKVKYISLVNLIADKAVVEELIQEKCNESELKAAFSRLLSNQTAIKREYGLIEKKLGSTFASATVARELANVLNSPQNGV